MNKGVFPEVVNGFYIVLFGHKKCQQLFGVDIFNSSITKIFIYLKLTI